MARYVVVPDSRGEVYGYDILDSRHRGTPFPSGRIVATSGHKQDAENVAAGLNQLKGEERDWRLADRQ